MSQKPNAGTGICRDFSVGSGSQTKNLQWGYGYSLEQHSESSTAPLFPRVSG